MLSQLSYSPGSERRTRIAASARFVKRKFVGLQQGLQPELRQGPQPVLRQGLQEGLRPVLRQGLRQGLQQGLR